MTQYLATTTLTSTATGATAITTTASATATATAGSTQPNENQFTLRRLMVWIDDPLQRLKLMAQLTDAAKGLKGGALVSAVGSYLSHGDPFVVAFVQRIMSQVCVTFDCALPFSCCSVGCGLHRHLIGVVW